VANKEERWLKRLKGVSREERRLRRRQDGSEDGKVAQYEVKWLKRRRVGSLGRKVAQ
jgi:hypothetical protein